MPAATQHRRAPGSEQQLSPTSAPELLLLPSLFNEPYRLYSARQHTFVFSFLAHFVVVLLLVLATRLGVIHRREIRQGAVVLLSDVSPYIFPSSLSKAGGGGGGGDRSKLAASKGALPQLSREQLAPPAIVVRNEHPKLAVEPTVVVPPEMKLPDVGSIGDPLSAVLGPPSNGFGAGGGIGSGSGGGIGSGNGPGVGPGWGGGIGGGVYRVRGGVSAPRVIYSPEPEFSEEARKAKHQGTVILSAIVGVDGRTHDIRVYRSLGMGLDEKAIEAIQHWRFEPGLKNGIAVPVLVSVEVNFRLY